MYWIKRVTGVGFALRIATFDRIPLRIKSGQTHGRQALNCFSTFEKRRSSMLYKVPLVLSPQAEGGFTVTAPLLPELLTEGDTVEEALANVHDALAAVVEAYEDLGRTLPANVRVVDTAQALWLETVSQPREVSQTQKLRALGCQELPRRTESSHRKWYNPGTQASDLIAGLGWAGSQAWNRSAVRQLGFEWQDFENA
jgi:antitoxin HicB